MPYEPADHAPVPRTALATWAVFAALLVKAFGVNIGRADFNGNGDYKALHARSGGADTGLSRRERPSTISLPRQRLELTDFELADRVWSGFEAEIYQNHVDDDAIG